MYCTYSFTSVIKGFLWRMPTIGNIFLTSCGAIDPCTLAAVLFAPVHPGGLFQAAFNKIPSGGPLLPLINGAVVLGAVGYCGYNSVFTGKWCPVVVARIIVYHVFLVVPNFYSSSSCG